MIDRNLSCVSTCIHFLPFSQYSLEISGTPYAPDDLRVKTDLLLLISFFIFVPLFSGEALVILPAAASLKDLQQHLKHSSFSPVNS